MDITRTIRPEHRDGEENVSGCSGKDTGPTWGRTQLRKEREARKARRAAERAKAEKCSPTSRKSEEKE